MTLQPAQLPIRPGQHAWTAHQTCRNLPCSTHRTRFKGIYFRQNVGLAAVIGLIGAIAAAVITNHDDSGKFASATPTVTVTKIQTIRVTPSPDPAPTSTSTSPSPTGTSAGRALSSGATSTPSVHILRPINRHPGWTPQWNGNLFIGPPELSHRNGRHRETGTEIKNHTISNIYLVTAGTPVAIRGALPTGRTNMLLVRQALRPI